MSEPCASFPPGADHQRRGGRREQPYPRQHTLGTEIIDLILDRIEALIDSCTGMQGFFIFHSFSGDSGAGLRLLLPEHLSVGDGESELELAVYPARQVSTTVVESDKRILASYAMIGDSG
jgi:tubulin alpha